MTKSHQHIIANIAKIRTTANLFIEDELKLRGLTGIVPAHGPVFAHLFQQDEPVAINSLVKKIGRVKSTVSGIVKTLERHGYIFKQQCPKDARSSQIGLTDKGWAIQKDFEEISEQLLELAYGNMTMDDRDQLGLLLAQIDENLMLFKR